MNQTPKRLTIKNICEIMNFSRSTYNKKVKTDPTFPKKLKSSNNRQGSVYHDAEEFFAWEKQNNITMKTIAQLPLAA